VYWNTERVWPDAEVRGTTELISVSIPNIAHFLVIVKKHLPIQHVSFLFTCLKRENYPVFSQFFVDNNSVSDSFLEKRVLIDPRRGGVRNNNSSWQNASGYFASKRDEVKAEETWSV